MIGEATRYERQSGLLPPDVLWNLPIAVAGVGAVGRQVVLQLVSAGARNIQFFDHDTVEEVNLGSQGWSPEAVGEHKVLALYNEVRVRYPVPAADELLEPRTARFPLGGLFPRILFCCVDGIETRENIFNAYRRDVELFLDSRVAGETVHVLAAGDPESFDYYPSTIFDAEDAFEAACTTRMSIHVANIAAGLLLQQMSKYLRDMPVDRHTVFNFLAMEAYAK